MAEFTVQIADVNLRFLPLALALLSGGSACSRAAERPLLESFFSAARLRDRTALADVATTAFEPRERGTVLSFDVASVRHVAADRKDVTVSARLRPPIGDTTDRSLVVSEQQIDGRWMVIEVRDAAPPISPGAFPPAPAPPPR
jgi:hypothetical protein